MLYANIPLRWVIRYRKAQNEPDFLGYSKRIYPTVGVEGTYSFESGPFYIPAAYCTVPLNSAPGTKSRAAVW